MNREERKRDVLSQITAFSNDSYTREKYLPELLKLQQEIVDLTFNSEHAERGELRIRDVEKHLRQLNEERGHPADDELEKFSRESKVFCNNIIAEISGNAGEQKVFRILDSLNCQNGVLHNVELEFDGRRTEIDAVVFTNRAVFIVEVKNSRKDIFIDENGEFYRIGHSMHHDCNIAKKMDEREFLLRKALERAGMDYLKIFKIIAFTNPNLDVENKYHKIKTCVYSYLPVFIEKFTSKTWYTYENICTMMAAVNEARCQDAFRMTIDMDEYKSDFAALIAALEAPEEEPEITMDKETEMVDEADEEAANDDLTENTAETADEEYKAQSSEKGIMAVAVAAIILNAAFYVIKRVIRK